MRIACDDRHAVTVLNVADKIERCLKGHKQMVRSHYANKYTVLWHALIYMTL